MLSTEKAREFVIETLQIPDLLTKLEATDGDQRLQLLNEMCRAFLNTVPFNNFHLMALPMSERTTPSEEDCIRACLSGEGGLCWTLNGFFYKLLQSLGLQVLPLICSVSVRDTSNHIAIRVDNLVKQGDQYLVDVGFGSPSFQAICLDFDVESPELHNSFNVAKIVKDAAGNFIRVHKTSRKEGSPGDVLVFPTVVDGWRHAYYFENKPTSLKTIYDFVDERVYRKPEDPFNQTLSFVTFHGDMAICLRDKVWLQENEEVVGTLVPSNVIFNQSLATRLSKHAPYIPKDTIVRAVENRLKIEAGGE